MDDQPADSTGASEQWDAGIPGLPPRHAKKAKKKPAKSKPKAKAKVKPAAKNKVVKKAPAKSKQPAPKKKVAKKDKPAAGTKAAGGARLDMRVTVALRKKIERHAAAKKRTITSLVEEWISKLK